MKKIASLLTLMLAFAVSVNAAVTSVTFNAVNGGTNTTRTYSVDAGAPITAITGTIVGTNTVASPGGCGITPTLPAGLTFTQTSNTVCQISGTPTVTSPTKTYFLDFHTSSGAPTDSLAFVTLTVGPITNLAYPQHYARFTKNTPITTITPTITGTPTSYSIAGTGVTDAASFNAATGLTFNPSTGAISGTPTANLALTKFTINATDGVYNTGGGAEGLVDSIKIAIVDPVDYSSWTYYKNIVVTPTGLGANVTNYPLLIKLTSTNFDFTQSASNIGSLAGSSITGNGGADLRFTLADGTTDLPYQIERWDATGQVAEIWVNVPAIASGSSTTIKMFWGKTSQTTTSSGPNTFPTGDNYQAVWHMNANGTGDEADATANGFTGTNAANPTNNTSGLIGLARTTNGTSQYFRVTGSASSVLSFPQNSQWTISSWVNPTAITQIGSGNGRTVVTKGNQQYALQISGNNPNGLTGNYWEAVEYQRVNQANSGTILSGLWPHAFGAATASVWANVVEVRKYGASMIYVNGALAGSQPTQIYVDRNGTNDRATGFDVVVAGKAGGTAPGSSFSGYFSGSLDEVALHNTARDSNWIKLNFQTQCSAGIPASCPSSPVAYGSTQLSGPPVGLAYSANPATYRQTIPITNNTPSLTSGGATSYSISPDLNANTGLTFNTATGVISGTPTLLSAPVNYLVTATNNAGSDTETVTITVTLPTAPNLTYTGSPYALTATRSAGTITPSNSGDLATSCSSTPTLPTGLSLSTACVITGTPTVSAASAAYSIISGNGGGLDTASVTIAVADTLPTISSQPAAKNAAVGASNVFFAVGANHGGAATVTYKWVRTKSGANGGAVDTIRVVSATTATVDTLTLSSDSVTVSADSSAYKVVVINSVGSVTSSSVLLRIIPTVSYSPATLGLGKVATTITPTTTSSITNCVSSPTLPAGLTIAPTTCVISGTPTTASAATNYSITPSGPGGTGTAFVLNLAVSNAPRVLTYTSDSTARFEQNVAIPSILPYVQDSLTAPLIFTVTSGALPAGLSLDSNTGAITGTPTAVGSTSPVITATNGSGSTARTLNITVYAAESYTGNNTVFTLNTTAGSAGVATSLANFPVLIRLNNTHRAIFQGSDSSGIRFTNAAGTHLPYQIENWSVSPSDTSAAIWVKADTISASGTTTVRMYWGQSLGGGRSEGQLVFPRSNGYQAVYHMSSGGTGDELDASNNGFTATPTNAPVDTVGVMGRARKFNGTSQYFTVANSASGALNFRVTDSRTLSSWIRSNAIIATGTNNGHMLVGKGNDQYSISIFDGAASATRYYQTMEKASGNYNQATSTPNAATVGNWRQITGVWKGAALGGTGIESLYVDGVPTSALSVASLSNSGRTETYNVAIGALAGGTAPNGTSFSRYMDGSMDEVRLSSVARSAAWIKMEYKNQKPGVLPVAGLTYASMSPTYTENAPITMNAPASIMGVATRYSAASLPAGLSLNTSTGEITGTPTLAAASAPYVITAYGDSSWSTTATLNITIAPSAPTGLSYVEDSLNLLVGEPITPDTAFFTGTTMIDSFTVSPSLPAGLTLNKTSGIISGAPSSPSASANFVVTAHNSAGTAKDTINIVVNDLVPSFTYTTPHTYLTGGAITTLNPVSTAGFVLAWSITPNLTTNTGLTFNTSTGAISGTPTTIQAATDYTIIGVNGVGSDTAVVSITINPAVPVISYASPKTFIKGVADSVSVSSTGGLVASYAVNPALPAGLVLNTSTGKIVGTPTVAASAANYSVIATNISGLDTAVINITVQDLTPVINYAALVDSFQVGVVAAKNAQSTGGTVTAWSINPALPTGLTFSTTTGGISGTPTVQSNAANYTVIGTNAYGADTVVLNLKVKQAVAIMPGAYAFLVNGSEKAYTFVIPAGVQGTEKVTMEITDLYGRQVWSRSVRPEANSTAGVELTWNGKTATGRLASAGMYVARISVVNGGKTTNYIQKSIKLKAN